MDVVATVHRIFVNLAALGRPVADRRRAGVTLSVVRDRFRSVGLDCHPHVEAAYSAADGTDERSGDTIGDLSLFPGYYWLTLDEAFQTYHALKLDRQWRQDWVPLFASGGGDFYAVVCSDREGAFGSMIGFIRGEAEQLIEFAHLGSLLEAIARSLEQGAFSVEENGFVANYPAFRAIAAEVSPEFVPLTVSAQT